MKKTTEEFIQKAREIHGDKYDYSKVEYLGCSKKVLIICPIHGEFLQKPIYHTANKSECPQCAHKSTPYTTKEFIEKSITIHKNKYDYSKTKYVNGQTEVTITCPIHGDFQQLGTLHLSGKGCQKCSKENNINKRKLPIIDIIKKAEKVHNNKYNYSKVKYKNSATPVTIICPIHGEFQQTINQHLKTKGCPKCTGKKSDTDIFIQKAKEIHGDKYDYSKVEYLNSTTKVIIICPSCGEFEQKPIYHLGGSKCPICIGRGIKKFLSYDECKKIIHQFNLTSNTEFHNWWVHHKSFCRKVGIPAAPHVYYKKYI